MRKRAKKYGISGNIKNKKKTLKNNENGDIINSEPTFELIKDEKVKEIYKDLFNNVPDDIKNVMTKYSYKLKVRKGRENSYYRYNNEIMYTEAGLNKYTISHEVGHFIDNVIFENKYKKRNRMISYNDLWSIEPEKTSIFHKAMNESMKKINGRSKGSKEFKALINKEMKETFTEMRKIEYSAIQDIVNGLTKGKLRYSWGHDNSYWKIPGAPHRETFANVFRLATHTGKKENDEMISFLNKHFPDIMTAFYEIIRSEVIK